MPTILDTAAAVITSEEASQVLWHFLGALEPGALEPGGFAGRLIGAIAAADPQNRGRLALGFPGYSLAVTIAMDVDDGLDLLRTLAKERGRRA